MLRAPKYSYAVPGDWNAICQRCRFQFKASELMDDGYKPGLKVCKKCWDSQHPQDYVQAKPDHQEAPWTRPEPTDQFDGTDVKGGDIGIPQSTYESNDGPGNGASDSRPASTFPNPTVVTKVTKA